jgi:hypothetical protein
MQCPFDPDQTHHFPSAVLPRLAMRPVRQLHCPWSETGSTPVQAAISSPDRPTAGCRLLSCQSWFESTSGGIECQHVAVSGIDAVCNAVICGVETRLLLQNAGLADVVIATV